jgi:hypothetical protein
MDRPIGFHRRDGVKAHASLGNIEHNSAIIKRQADIRQPFQRFPYAQATLALHHGIIARDF